MLYSKFSEGSDYSQDGSSSIKITDISFETFEDFLNYIYTGELLLKADGNEMGRLIELSYCAQKYLIEDMRKQCLDRLTKFLTPDTVLMFIGKSFDMHLEDFLVSCLYFVADLLEAGNSCCNLILNNEKLHLTPRCFEFLVKNLMDYFGERDDVLCLIKAWSFLQCQEDDLDVNDETLAVTLSKLNLDDALSEKIVQLKSAFVEASPRFSRSFHRVHYKPIRPLIIDRHQRSFDAQISFKRFSIVNSLLVNSRLIPEQFDICEMSHETYSESLDVEVIDKSSDKSLYKRHHTIDGVSFNSLFTIKFDGSMILFPHHVYIVRLSWSDEAFGYEYPRCIFSLMEKGSEVKADDNKNPLSVVQFHEYNYCYNSPLGSIVQGIAYDLIS